MYRTDLFFVRWWFKKRGRIQVPKFKGSGVFWHWYLRMCCNIRMEREYTNQGNKKNPCRSGEALHISAITQTGNHDAIFVEWEMLSKETLQYALSHFSLNLWTVLRAELCNTLHRYFLSCLFDCIECISVDAATQANQQFACIVSLSIASYCCFCNCASCLGVVLCARSFVSLVRLLILCTGRRLPAARNELGAKAHRQDWEHATHYFKGRSLEEASFKGHCETSQFTHGQHTVNIRSTHGQHTVNTFRKYKKFDTLPTKAASIWWPCLKYWNIL